MPQAERDLGRYRFVGPPAQKSEGTGLEDRLAAVYDPSDNVKQGRPQLETAGTELPLAFVDWLDRWRRFAAAEIHRTSIPGPLICCIDGLDEAPEPDADQDNWPLALLPRPELLPDGLYLVLTSRPAADPTSPAFLRRQVAALYPGTALEVAEPA